jgi:hypothetical protein
MGQLILHNFTMQRTEQVQPLLDGGTSVFEVAARMTQSDFCASPQTFLLWKMDCATKCIALSDPPHNSAPHQ